MKQTFSPWGELLYVKIYVRKLCGFLQYSSRKSRTNGVVAIMGVPTDMIHMVMLGPLKIRSCTPTQHIQGMEITSDSHPSKPHHNSKNNGGAIGLLCLGQQF